MLCINLFLVIVFTNRLIILRLSQSHYILLKIVNLPILRIDYILLFSLDTLDLITVLLCYPISILIHRVDLGL